MSDRSGLSAVGFLVAVAALGLGCSPPVAPQTPPPPAGSAPADASSSAPPAVDHLEECLTRVLQEGIPSKASGAAEGNALARAAEAKRVQGDGKSERETYLQLIQDSPHSPYVPFAYFRFGELFKAEAQTDPSKAALAEEAYKAALKVPAPGNRLFLLTRFRLGQISEVENQPANARDAYQGALDDASANADWDCAVEVAEGAQRSLEALNAKTNAEE